MANMMDLEFVLTVDELEDSQKNPFGSMDYELMDVGRNF